MLSGNILWSRLAVALGSTLTEPIITTATVMLPTLAYLGPLWALSQAQQHPLTCAYDDLRLL